MQELIEYKCPSCGASLKVAAGEEYLTCEFCKASLRRELSDSERDMASGKKITKDLMQYKKDLARHKLLQSTVARLSDETVGLSQNDSPLMKWAVPMHICSILVCVLLFFIAAKDDNKKMMIMTGILYIVSLIVIITACNRRLRNRKKSEAYIRQLNEKLAELTSAKVELEKFERSFDASFLPEQYRNDDALDALIDIFRTGKASRLGDGIRLYDKQLYRNNMQQLTLEQMQIHQKQLEKLEELSDYGFDDTYDDDDFDLEETAAAVKASINDTLRTQQMSRELESRLNDDDDL